MEDKREDGEPASLVFLALGTQGDVIPLCALAASTFALCKPRHLVVITHKETEAVAVRVLNNSFKSDSETIRCVTIDYTADGKDQHSLSPQRRGPCTVILLRAVPLLFGDSPAGVKRKIACLNTADDADNDTETYTCTAADDWISSGVREMTVILGVVRQISPPPRLLVYNLYASVGYHIAQSLDIASVVCHAGLVPSNVSAQGEAVIEYLRTRYPKMLDDPKACSVINDGRSVQSLFDLQHWMTPLVVSPVHAAFRKTLRLPPIPLSMLSTKRRPLRVPVLYGTSSLLNQRPGHWPDAYHVTGPWTYFEECSQTSVSSVRVFVERVRLAGRRVAAVGFGSLAGTNLISMGALIRGCNSIIDTLHAHNYAVVSQGLALESSDIHLSLTDTFIPHMHLFTYVDVVVHHGGAGTIVAALRCGCPQLVFPIAYDQHTWAQKVEWAGVGRDCGPLVEAEQHRSEFGAALLWSQDAATKQMTRQYREEALKDDGLIKAGTIIAALWNSSDRFYQKSETPLVSETQTVATSSQSAALDV